MHTGHACSTCTFENAAWGSCVFLLEWTLVEPCEALWCPLNQDTGRHSYPLLFTLVQSRATSAQDAISQIASSNRPRALGWDRLASELSHLDELVTFLNTSTPGNNSFVNAITTSALPGTLFVRHA